MTLRRRIIIGDSIMLEPVPERALGGAIAKLSGEAELDRDELVALRDAIDEAIER